MFQGGNSGSGNVFSNPAAIQGLIGENSPRAQTFREGVIAKAKGLTFISNGKTYKADDLDPTNCTAESSKLFYDLHNHNLTQSMAATINANPHSTSEDLVSAAKNAITLPKLSPAEVAEKEARLEAVKRAQTPEAAQNAQNIKDKTRHSQENFDKKQQENAKAANASTADKAAKDEADKATEDESIARTKAENAEKKRLKQRSGGSAQTSGFLQTLNDAMRYQVELAAIIALLDVLWLPVDILCHFIKNTKEIAPTDLSQLVSVFSKTASDTSKTIDDNLGFGSKAKAGDPNNNDDQALHRPPPAPAAPRPGGGS